MSFSILGCIIKYLQIYFESPIHISISPVLLSKHFAFFPLHTKFVKTKFDLNLSSQQYYVSLISINVIDLSVEASFLELFDFY